jgi:hypothetical protein
MANMRRTTFAAALGVLLAGAQGPPAWAGLLDSPAPNFDGVPGKVIYRMGPVHHDAGAVDTLVTCANVGDVPVRLALEIFDGNDRSAGFPTQATLAVGASVTFVTSAGAGDGTVVLGLPPMEDGKARVSATSTRISCSGRLRLRSGGGDVRETPLELVKKVAFGD